MNEYSEKGLTIKYKVRVSPRARHAYLKLLEDGTVEAILPKRMSRRHVPDMLGANQAWILDMQQQLRLKQEKNPVRYEQFPQKIRLCAIGESWEVRYINPELEPGPNIRYCEINDGLFPQLVVYENNEQKVRTVLQAWLRKKALKSLVPRFARVSEKIQISYNKVSIRAQKSRWGSCSRTANISLNMALLFLPPELLNYVFIHELCHTRHMNHSSEYWALVESFEPDYKRLDRELNRQSERVPLWIHKT